MRAILPTIIFGLFFFGSAIADDLGRIGTLYRIGEKDLLEVITAHFKEMERSGDLAKKQKEYQAQVISGFENPRPVLGLTKSTVARTYYLDPSVQADTDIRDSEGKLVAAKGTHVNPLSVVNLSNHLVFIDGREPSQVTLALDLAKQYQGKTKTILTGGQPLELMRKLRVKLFYDQGGRLVQRFAIKHLPAIVSQDGNRLRVDELVIR